MTDAAGLRATGALHCNLNVRTLAAASGLFEALGLRVKMRSRAEGQDATAMGLGDATDSEAWFLYDRREGAARPPSSSSNGSTPRPPGRCTHTPVRSACRRSGSRCPISVRQSTPSRPRVPMCVPGGPAGIDAVILDADGVALELSAAPVESAILRYVRIVCADLERSARWYAMLGFDPIGTQGPIRWEHAGEVADVVEQRLSLAGPPPLELRLTRWPSHPATAAHGRANDRGLFRMALAVPDVRAAVEAARHSGAIEASDASLIPLPGTPLGGLWVSFFKDPDGVMVEYVERSIGS